MPTKRKRLNAMPELPALLTDALSSHPLTVFLSHERTLTNMRTIPYAERYRQHSGIWETPEEHLQRAGEDEAKRAALAQ